MFLAHCWSSLSLLVPGKLRNNEFYHPVKDKQTSNPRKTFKGALFFWSSEWSSSGVFSLCRNKSGPRTALGLPQ